MECESGCRGSGHWIVICVFAAAAGHLLVIAPWDCCGVGLFRSLSS